MSKFIIIVAVLATAAILLLMRIEPPVTHVTFIVPDDYQGTFWVIPNDPHGIRPRAVENGFVLQVPRSGLLRTENDVFSGWVSMHFVTESGHPIREYSIHWPPDEFVYVADLLQVVAEGGGDSNPIIFYVGSAGVYRDMVKHRIDLWSVTPGSQ